MHSAVLKWALRASFVCTCLALLAHARLWKIESSLVVGATFFAIITGAFSSFPSLGASIRTVVHISTGSVIGGVLALIVLASSGNDTPSIAIVWPCLIVISFIILLPAPPLMTTKLSLAVFLTSIVGAMEGGGGVGLTYSLIVGSLAGTTTAFLSSLLFAARASANMQRARLASTTALCRAAKSAAIFFALPHERGIAARRAILAATEASSARAAYAAAEADAVWEENVNLLGSYLWQCFCQCRRYRRCCCCCCRISESSVPSPPIPSITRDNLRALALAVEGLCLALRAASEGDGKLRDSAAAASAARRIVDASRGGLRSGIETEQLSVDAAIKAASQLDAHISAAACQLAAATERLLLVRCNSSSSGSSDMARSAAAEVVSALAALDEELLRGRGEAYYHRSTGLRSAAAATTVEGDDTGGSDVAELMAVALFGVPSGRYLFVFSIRSFAAAALAGTHKTVRGHSADDSNALSITISSDAAGNAASEERATPLKSVAPSSEGERPETNSRSPTSIIPPTASSSSSAPFPPVAPALSRLPSSCCRSCGSGGKLFSSIISSFYRNCIPRRPSQTRILYAIRITASVSVAVAAGRALLGSGTWAAAAVAFVAPRDLSTKTMGGSLHAAFLRITGTIAGCVVGLVIAIAGNAVEVANGGGGDTNTAGSVLYPGTALSPRLLVSIFVLSIWVAAVGLIRSSPRHAYGAAVAQFTPYLFLDFPKDSIEKGALARVAQNVLGLAIFVAMELLLAPATVARAQRAAMSAALDAARAAVEAVSSTVLLTGGGGRGKGEEVMEALHSLESATRLQKDLLKEAADEPDWAPFAIRCCSIGEDNGNSSQRLLRTKPSTAPLPDVACLAALRTSERAAMLLGLVSELVADTPFSASGAERVLAPCAPALQLMLRALSMRYKALSVKALSGMQGSINGAASAVSAISLSSSRAMRGGGHLRESLEIAATDLDAALHAMFLETIQKTKKNKMALVANDDLVRVVALAWLVRELAQNAVEIEDAVLWEEDASSEVETMSHDLDHVESTATASRNCPPSQALRI